MRLCQYPYVPVSAPQAVAVLDHTRVARAAAAAAVAAVAGAAGLKDETGEQDEEGLVVLQVEGAVPHAVVLWVDHDMCAAADCAQSGPRAGRPPVLSTGASDARGLQMVPWCKQAVHILPCDVRAAAEARLQAKEGTCRLEVSWSSAYCHAASEEYSVSFRVLGS